jgi:adenosylcobinamide-GDP ribazoletransferase
MNDQSNSTRGATETRPGWHPGQWWREIRIAIGFFTRLPFSAPPGPTSGRIAEAARAFPIAGAVVGLIGSGIYLLGIEVGLSALLAALLALAATVVVGGALHEDGLADFADMLGVRGERERKLAVMRDSRIGSYGVLALGFSTAIKVAALVGLGEPGAVAGALVTAHVCGRAVLPMLMRSLPLARTGGLAVDAGKPSAPATYQSLGIGLLISAFACGPGCALVCIVVAIVAAFLVSEVARRQIGGYTGDVLGAAQEIAQLAVLINIVSLA